MNIAIYARKSKLSEKGDSTLNQIQSCKDYIKEFFPNTTHIFTYTDEGFSGSDTNRPMFNQMLQDAKSKQINVLICYRLDRISRNIAQFSNTYEILQKYNIEFVSVKEQFDTSNPIGRAMLSIAMVFSQLERETIAERIKDNMHALACSGRWLGGRCPTGFKSQRVESYDTQKNKRVMFKLYPIPEEVNLVIMIFNSYINFQNLRQVEGYLLKLGIKTKNNCNFSAATIRDILINPVYAYADQDIYHYFYTAGAKVCGNCSDYNGKYGVSGYNRTDQSNRSGKPKDVDQWIISIGKHIGIIPGLEWIKVQKILQKNSKRKFCRDSICNSSDTSGFGIYDITGNYNELAEIDVTESTLGAMVNRARIEKGLSIIQLSDLVGMDCEMVPLLEDNAHLPNPEHLKKIGEVLKIDISEYDERYRFSLNQKKNLQVNMKNLGMSRKQFADYVGISEGALNSWWYNYSEISRRTFNKLEEKLGPDFYIM